MYLFDYVAVENPFGSLATKIVLEVVSLFIKIVALIKFNLSTIGQHSSNNMYTN